MNHSIKFWKHDFYNFFFFGLKSIFIGRIQILYIDIAVNASLGVTDGMGISGGRISFGGLYAFFLVLLLVLVKFGLDFEIADEALVIFIQISIRNPS